MARPRKYKSVEEMQAAIDDYFDSTKKITICGLALHLGFVSRQSLLDYQGYSKKFFDTLKKAKLRIESYYEEHLTEGNAGGSIFALKNFNWKDSHEVEVDDKRMSKEEIEQVRNYLQTKETD